MKRRESLFKRNMAVDLAAAVAGSSLAGGFPVLASEDTAGKSIVSLTTDGLENPIGVDTQTPVFSWRIQRGKRLLYL